MCDSPRIFDCFTFSNELGLLSFRFATLAPFVDYFVIVEAPRTHSGKAKPLYYQDNAASFLSYANKIIHVVVDDLPPPDPDRWVPEIHQRRAILRGLSHAQPFDIALVSDVDEIPSPDVVCQLKETTASSIGFEMRTCYLRANWESSQVWPLARAARVGALKDPQALRESQPELWMPEAGAHLSYMMSAEEIAAKYGAFAHSELDVPRERSPRYLDLAASARISPFAGEPLRVRQSHELTTVQQNFLSVGPDLFDFRRQRATVQRLAARWSRFRRRRSVPNWLVEAGDAVGVWVARATLARATRSTAGSDE